jgi:hypothetical protein
MVHAFRRLLLQKDIPCINFSYIHYVRATVLHNRPIRVLVLEQEKRAFENIFSWLPDDQLRIIKDGETYGFLHAIKILICDFMRDVGPYKYVSENVNKICNAPSTLSLYLGEILDMANITCLREEYIALLQKPQDVSGGKTTSNIPDSFHIGARQDFSPVYKKIIVPENEMEKRWANHVGGTCMASFKRKLDFLELKKLSLPSDSWDDFPAKFPELFKKELLTFRKDVNNIARVLYTLFPTPFQEIILDCLTKEMETRAVAAASSCASSKAPRAKGKKR